jgi:hypothetical protein
MLIGTISTDEVVRILINKRVLAMFLLSWGWASMLGALYFTVRVGKEWIQSLKSMEKLKENLEYNIDRFQKAHEILKEKATAYFGISYEQIREELDESIKEDTQ